jgi:SAM-dependent methyltransferase
MIAYYSVAARQEYWNEHWSNHSTEELIAIARQSPLTKLICAALPPPPSLVLEAGCGRGQYVVLLREWGWRAIGVDWSVEALAGCRRVAPVPLAGMDLTALAVRDGTVSAYISLGVVEHDPRGPDAILAEAHRVLRPGGVVAVAVPYVNGARWLAAPWIRRRQRLRAQDGAGFYQFAFSRSELLSALERHGFRPMRVAAYGSAYLLRKVLRRLRRAFGRGRPGASTSPSSSAGRSRIAPGQHSIIARAARNLLSAEPLPRLLGHMLLVVARRE